MSSPTDQQLIQYIGQGRRDALAQLFDRYSADLYDYLARLVGDRDQAARLLDQVMLRVPGAAAGFQARDSVRGWLYSIARESGLDWLRQRGWLDGLPPSDEPIAPGLQGDVWKAARAMPGFFRAVLITEELQPLSPTEKGRALGVNRTDLARLIEEARKSFNRIYDAQARAEGRPTSDRINTDAVWNARRRLPVEGGSLFGFLPQIEFPDSLKQQIRRHVVEAMSPPPARPMGGIAADAGAPAGPPPPPDEPPLQVPVLVPQPEPPLPMRQAQPVPQYEPPVRTNALSGFTGLPSTALAALLGIALALLICGGVFWLLQNRSKLAITAVEPQDAATVPFSPDLTVGASFTGAGEIDRTTSSLQVDGRGYQFQIINNDTIAWHGALEVGSHVANVLIVDRDNNRAQKSWSFFVTGASTPIPPPSGQPSVTPLVPLESVTPIVPVTAQIVTVTPIIIPQSPTAPFATQTPIIWTPTFIAPTNPPFTPCNRGGVSGIAFNDLNQNGQREPNEPGLGGVSINLATQLNSIVAVAVTDAFGNYRFSDIPFGSYRVVATTPSNWVATSPTNIPVFIGGCGVIPNFNFGFVQSTPTAATWTPTAPVSFAVVNGATFVSPPSSLTCPQTFSFNGTLTTNGAGTVTYRWVHSDGFQGPVQSLPFAFASTQNVATDTWSLNSSFAGWSQIQVLTPNFFASPQANFTLTCVGPTFTPSATTAPPFAVTSVNASVSPTSSSTCPQTFLFDGSITANGSGVATYQWMRSDGSVSPAQTVTFLIAGTQNVATDSWTLGAPGFNTTGWDRIQVLSPNSISSPQATFTLNCPPITDTPTVSPTPSDTPTPSATVPPPFTVTGANASVAPTSAALCPANFNFGGDITVTGTGTVNYEWVGSDSLGNNYTGPASTLTFLAPGTQPLTLAYSIPYAGPGPLNVIGKAHIHVTSPNAFDSGDANYTLNCP